jgi:hypothetical protein
MDSFMTIRFKRKTAKRFQEFSKTHFKTHTDTMEAILDFFFYNEISPKEKLGPTGRTLEDSLNKRINAIIAIMKNIEKHQTKPTVAMMQALFAATETEKKPRMIAKSPEEFKAQFEKNKAESESKIDNRWNT